LLQARSLHQQLDLITPVDEKLSTLLWLILIGFNTIMPERTRTIYSNDALWMTQELKSQIRKCQTTLAEGNQVLFKYYHNLVNRSCKRCREVYYNTKVARLKDSKPKHWCNEVKRISGHSPVSNRNNTNIESLLPTQITDQRSCNELANFINESFLEPQQMFEPLDESSKLCDENFTSLTSKLQVTELEVFLKLKSLNASKSPGPDGVPSWLLKDFAEILAYPITLVINSSFEQEHLPLAWKQANISHIRKASQVNETTLNVNKLLCPISLTPIISKLAEDFIIQKDLKSAVLEIFDKNEFGVVPKSSTVMALTSMIHSWLYRQLLA
jgi:hypothetical protein